MATDTAWQGKRIVITGALPAMTRQQAQQKIIERGGHVDDAVTRRTDLLVWSGGKSSQKLWDALRRDTPIATGAWLIEQLKLPCPEPLPKATDPETLAQAKKAVRQAERNPARQQALL